MNNTVQINHLTKFTPAEVFVIQKGIYTNLCEILRQMLHHFVLCKWLSLKRIGDVVLVADTMLPLPKANEFEVLKLIFAKLGKTQIPLNQYIQVLQESTDEDELIRSIMRRIKKAGYLKQNLWHRLTRTYALSVNGHNLCSKLHNEINALKKRFAKTSNRDLPPKITPLIGANQWFITNRLPDELLRFDDYWIQLIAAREAARVKERENESGGGCATFGIELSGCSGCSGCGGD